jgi:hypothetical protein
MRIYLRFTAVLALAGALALGGASTARAQDTSQVRADTSDTSGYQGYEGRDTSAAAAQPTGGADSGAAGYTGPPTDTTLKAKAGVQTGPTAGDSGKAGKPSATAADTVACKDGSNAPRTDGCAKNGGIDWAATEAAMKARGERTTGRDTSTAAPADTGTMPMDTTQPK